jgi:hypothetical protein
MEGRTFVASVRLELPEEASDIGESELAVRIWELLEERDLVVHGVDVREVFV